MIATPRNTLDALIIGGGPVGLTSALYLGRARRSVAVIDAGTPRHNVSDAIHNFLTREGMAPKSLRTVAWEQMKTYTSVQPIDGAVTALECAGNAWTATVQGLGYLRARAVLLATGVSDTHPDIPGYRSRWGHSIHHCPYCHGWEMRDRPLAVLASGQAAAHLAPILKGWSDDVVVVTHGGDLDSATRQVLAKRAIDVFESPIKRLEGPGSALAELHLADGTVLKRDGLFVAAAQKQVPLVDSLGLDMVDGYVEVDPLGATSLPGVWAAGDLTSRMQQVVIAAAEGAKAGAAINAHLAFAGDSAGFPGPNHDETLAHD